MSFLFETAGDILHRLAVIQPYFEDIAVVELVKRNLCLYECYVIFNPPNSRG